MRRDPCCRIQALCLDNMRRDETFEGVQFAIETHETSWGSWISWAEISDQPTGKRVIHEIGLMGYHEEFLDEEEAIASARRVAHQAINEYR
jgi:hypothetical protein